MNIQILFFLLISSSVVATRTQKLDGISFLVKSCDEPTLIESVTSLKDIHVPHEIVVIVHHCMGVRNQTSFDQAMRLHGIQNLSIYEYSTQISRPGYETLVTDPHSEHSLIRYFNWALEKTRHKWVVKWDADFLMTPALAAWIQTHLSLWSRTNEVVVLEAKNEHASEINPYFSSCITHYVKDIFYEMAHQQIIPTTHVQHNLVGSEVFIYHKSDPRIIKPYWLAQPWFEKEESEEAARVRARLATVIKRFGPFPGFARSVETKNATLLGTRIATQGIDLLEQYGSHFG